MKPGAQKSDSTQQAPATDDPPTSEKFTSEQIHRAAFPDPPQRPVSVEAMDEAIATRLKRRRG